MPDAVGCAFLYLETALHVGTSQQGYAIDLPIERDASGAPVIPANTLRGSVLATARKRRDKDEITWAFGSPPGSDMEKEGVLTFNPCQILLFPVRTYKGVFAWITSPQWLSAWQTAVGECGREGSMVSVPEPGDHEAVVAPQAPVLTESRTLIIEDFSFPVREAAEVAALGEWFGRHAMPQDSSYQFFRERLQNALVVLPDDVCRFLLRHRVPVTRRVAINPQTGVAEEGALWTEEFLPSETLFHTLIGTENRDTPPPVPVNGVSWLKQLELKHLQVGANRTLGDGFVRWTWLNGG
ncbi:MAG: type III-B CRISPR module RAMP protein Cmr4 [Planctomycetota bacterium]